MRARHGPRNDQPRLHLGAHIDQAMMPTPEEKLHAAEEHLTLLQGRLISLKDNHPHEPNQQYEDDVADLEHQIASIIQDIEYHREELPSGAAGLPREALDNKYVVLRTRPTMRVGMEGEG